MNPFPFLLILLLQSHGLAAAVKYSNCTTAAFVAKPAQRLVTLDINSTEMALALHLSPLIVGVAGVENPALIMENYQLEAQGLTYLAPYYPSLAQLQKVRPDLVLGGWRNGFSRGTPMEPKKLLAQSIASYVLRETCAHEEDHVATAATFANTLFQDLDAIGRLTGAELRARSLQQAMQQRLDRVAVDVAAHGRQDKVRIFVYDGGLDHALTVGAGALLTEVLRLAGGQNVFHDRPGSWQQANWSEVIQRDPELIVIVDYGAGDAGYKIQDLVSNPELRSITAVQRQQFFIIPYAAAITGIRSVGLTELLADHLICNFNPLFLGVEQCLDVPYAF